MKKVLIISYYFPPSNFVGGDRTLGWAKHLKKLGYYPIVVTRNWNKNQKDITDSIENNEFHIDSLEDYEVHYLPFKNTLRDKLTKYPSLLLLQKALTFFEILLGALSKKFHPTKNFFDYTKKIIKEDHSIIGVIASGGPFHSFQIGFELKKQFKNILWLPDYRDEWNTNRNVKKQHFANRIIKKLLVKNEKKWTSNADFFITVSEECKFSISNLIQKKGITISNGFNPSDFDLNQPIKETKNLTISYSGTLYDYQNIEWIIKAVQHINKQLDFPIKLNFIGVDTIESQKQRILNLSTNDENICVFNRLPKVELSQLLLNSDILLLTAYSGSKGLFPVKFYEYAFIGKPILLVPSDNGLLELELTKNKLGYHARTYDECLDILTNLVHEKLENCKLSFSRNNEYIQRFDRIEQTKLLANAIDKRLSNPKEKKDDNKLLIVSYFYPPANFVGGERTSFWSENLIKKDIYPIVLTRNWNLNQTDIVDRVEDNDFFIDKNEIREIHQVQYVQSTRDRIANKGKFKFIQKLFTLYEVIFSNFFLKSIPYSNFYQHAKTIIINNPEIKVIIISGRPFQSFFIGYLIKKDFPHINWIPDYRDEWNSHQNLGKLNLLKKIIFYLEKRSELKWTSNANYFLTVSEPWKNSISNLIKIPGYVIKNGYTELKHLEINKTRDKTLRLTYAGTLYPTQKIELLIESFNEFITNGNTKMEFTFVGLNVYPEQEERVKKAILGFEQYYKFIDRTDRNNLLKIIQNSDLLALTAFDKIKGWYPVKLFDYFSFGKPILLVPSDDDVMQDFIRATNAGFICNNKEETISLLEKFYFVKQNNKKIELEINTHAAEEFSRLYQTNKLADFLKQFYE